MALKNSQSMETRLTVLETEAFLKFDFIEKSFIDFNKKMDKIDSKQDEISKGLQERDIKERDHYWDCPNTKKIEIIEEKLDIRLDKIEKRVSKIDFVFENPKLTIGSIVVLVLIALFFINLEVNYKMNSTFDPINKQLYYFRNPNEKPVYRGDNPKDWLNQKDTIK